MLKLDRRLIRDILVLTAVKAALLATIYLTLFAPHRPDPALQIASRLLPSIPAR